MLTAPDFSGLINPRFVNNLFPIPATNPLAIGTLAPDFVLPNVQNQQQVQLSHYRGKRAVILAFTRIFTEKFYCPVCFPHIKALNEAYPAFRDRRVELLLITSTDERQSKIVSRDLNLQMPLLSDSRCQVFRAYATGRALGAPLPAQFVLDRRGELRYKHLFSFLEPNASIETLLSKLDSEL